MVPGSDVEIDDTVPKPAAAGLRLDPVPVEEVEEEPVRAPEEDVEPVRAPLEEVEAELSDVRVLMACTRRRRHY